MTHKVIIMYNRFNTILFSLRNHEMLTSDFYNPIVSNYVLDGTYLNKNGWWFYFLCDFYLMFANNTK
mgnify:CR=1 FL=1